MPHGVRGDVDRERAMLTEYLKLLAWWLGRPPTPPLPPRQDQTLRGLLSGLSEKEIARTLGVSVHTVHDYVKDLYRRFNVTTRGELFTCFLPTLRTAQASAAASGANGRLTGNKSPRA